MTESEPAAALRVHFRASRQSSEPHVSAEDLVAYRSETLESDRQQGVRDHLVACEECSELLLDLAELEDTGGRVEGISEFEVEAAWRRQYKRLFPGLIRRQAGFWQLGGWVAAACMTLVAGTLGFELRRTSARFYSEDLPRVVIEEQGQRSSRAELPVLNLESGKAGLVILLLRSDSPFESFRAEFLSQTGHSLLIREGLSAAEDLLLIQIKPELMPSGRIRVVVSGLREGRYEPVGEYGLRVDES